MGRAAGWDLCLDIPASGVVIHKDLIASCCQFGPLLCLSLIPSDWALQWSPWGETPVSLPGSVMQHWRSWISTLDSFFPLEKLQAQGASLLVALCQAGGRVMLSKCSYSSYHYNAVCLSLCDIGGFFSPILGFWDFHSSVLSVDSW